jgi:hypothetical protein
MECSHHINAYMCYRYHMCCLARYGNPIVTRLGYTVRDVGTAGTCTMYVNA